MKIYTIKTTLLYIGIVCSLYGCSKSGDNKGTPATKTFTLYTAAVTNITTSSATGGGTLAGTGDNNPPEDIGVCWDIKHNPTLATYTSSGAVPAQVGKYSTTMYGLCGGTTYYVRATAQNSQGARIYGNEVSFTTPAATIAIGQSYAGGIIFYVDNTGQHGLVMAPFDELLGAVWDNGNFKNAPLVTDTVVGSGQNNTSQLIQVMGNAPGYAALNATQFVLNGYNDWYLPSKGEFALMESNLAGINLGVSVLHNGYWTSSTDAIIDESAWLYGAGSFTLYAEYEIRGIRPIRSF